MKTNWQTKKIGEVCDILDNLRKPVTARDRKSGDFPYYGATGIQDYVDSFIFNEELVLVGEDGARWNSGDNTAFKISGKTWVNNHAHVIRPYRDILLDQWLIYFLNISDLSDYITGTTVKKLNQEKLRSIPVPLPPIKIQKEIVVKLDKKFTKLREAKRLREEALSDTEKILSQTLREIFEEGKQKGWEEKTLPEISENLDSMRKPITKSDRKDGKHPYYGASGIVDSVEGYLFDEELLLISEDGANLIARSTPIAFTANGKYWVNNHAHVLRFRNKILQRITEYYLNYINVKPYITGSAQPKLSQANLNKIKIIIPPQIDQQKIVNKLNEVSEKVRTLHELQTSQLADLKHLEKSYLREAFNGEL